MVLDVSGLPPPPPRHLGEDDWISFLVKVIYSRSDPQMNKRKRGSKHFSKDADNVVLGMVILRCTLHTLRRFFYYHLVDKETEAWRSFCPR